MTEDLHPGLGSGALREALQKWQRKYFSAGISHEMWPNAVEHAFEAGWLAALSLSSPIEPPSREAMKAQWEIYRKQRWPDREEGWSNHWSDIAIDFALALAQPTQASSEVREARLQELDGVEKHLTQHPYGASVRQWIKERRAVLAPSRQGAGGK